VPFSGKRGKKQEHKKKKRKEKEIAKAPGKEFPSFSVLA